MAENGRHRHIHVEDRGLALAVSVPADGHAADAKVIVRPVGDAIAIEWEGEPGPDRERWEQLASRRWELRRDWCARVDRLVGQVEGWARREGWATKRLPKRLEDREIGRHTVPALLMQEGLHRVMVEPLGRASFGVEGVVDLYHLPAYDDVARLTFSDGDWRISPRFSDGRSPKPLGAVALSDESLGRVMEEFRAHAVQG